eukprot:GHVU01164411.1.p1 GENE.GHVU01164411.1~~GHVU01164411.1.p1  ORF type:complete len:201 (+),score=34.24 GHVU01164411.1:24-626(+)
MPFYGLLWLLPLFLSSSLPPSVRSSLPLLPEGLQSKLFTFVTLSSPHLGYLYGANRLVDAGMWFLKRWSKSLCLQQLTMTDSKTPRQCALYKLSNSGHVELFRHVVLVSSFQDQYAPYESARIERGTKSKEDPKLGAAYQEMAHNILGKVKKERLFRIDVDFKIPDRNLDTMIGRAAHIQFLESITLISMLVEMYTFLFA